MAEDTKVNESLKVVTKDKWAILALRTKGHVADKIVSNIQNNQKVLMYHFTDAAYTDYDSWSRGENKEPWITIRAVKAADQEFKDNLHRFCSNGVE